MGGRPAPWVDALALGWHGTWMDVHAMSARASLCCPHTEAGSAAAALPSLRRHVLLASTLSAFNLSRLYLNEPPLPAGGKSPQLIQCIQR